MSKRIKELTERRGAKLHEAAALIELAKAESRDLSGDELSKIEGIHTESEAITRNLQAEARQLAEEARKFSPSAGENRDLEKFSLGRMLTRLGLGQPLEGIDAELTQEGEREARSCGISPRGVMVPRFATRDMTATAGTSLNQGGMTIQTDKAGLLDELFNRSVLAQAGVTILNGLTGNLDIPRLVKGTAPAGRTENQAVVEYTATTAMLSLTPKRIPTVIEVSNQLLKQSSTQPLEAVIRRHLEAHLMQAVQVGLLHGAGTTAPVGVAATSGIGAVVGATNGAAPDYTDIVHLQREVAVDDADFGSLAFIINSKTEAKLKLTARIASTDSMTIIDPRAPNNIDGRRYFVTNSVSSVLEKGGSGTTASAIFYGNWADLWWANWGGIEFLVNPFSKDGEGLTRINAAIYYDGGVVRPVSFAAMLDALTA